MPSIGAIERGIALPPSKRGDGTLRATLARMQVGESFETVYTRDAAARMAKKLGVRVATRKQYGGKCRVWRIA